MNAIKQTIGYADYSFNPVTGCKHDCPYCYARGLAERFRPKAGESQRQWRSGICLAEPGDVFPRGFEPTFYAHRLAEIDRLKNKPSRIFVGDMTDLFGDWVPNWLLGYVFTELLAHPSHQYLLLTKAPQNYQRALEVLEELGNGWEANWWAGTTVTEAADGWRLDELRKLDAHRWVSFEPILRDISSLDLTGIDWAVVGPCTPVRSRTADYKFIMAAVEKCQQEHIPVWMKKACRHFVGGELVQQMPEGWER